MYIFYTVCKKVEDPVEGVKMVKCVLFLDDDLSMISLSRLLTSPKPCHTWKRRPCRMQPSPPGLHFAEWENSRKRTPEGKGKIRMYLALRGQTSYLYAEKEERLKAYLGNLHYILRV
jgi:hypothetical protein